MTELALNNGKAINDYALYLDKDSFEQSQRAARLLSESTLVPDAYKGNLSNCFIALHQAAKLGVDPLLFMQKSFILKGKTGVEAQVIIGALNSSGLIKGRVDYELSGQGLKRTCIASAIDARTGEKRSYSLILEDALKVGTAGSNVNWKAIPDLMLCYRSATYLIRLHYPDVMLGLYSKDELNDIKSTVIDVTPAGLVDPLPEAIYSNNQINQGETAEMAETVQIKKQHDMHVDTEVLSVGGKLNDAS
jgi:hypothetical protein